MANDFTNHQYDSLLQYRISRILMICTSYDAFIMEEDGKIESRIYEEYFELGLSDPPKFTWVNNSRDARGLLEGGGRFDLVIGMYNEQDQGIFSLARDVKESNPSLPFVLLMHYSKEIRRKLTSQKDSAVDFIFSWHGNADLILAIIKLLEDMANAPRDILRYGVQSILLAEDSIRFYSTYLPELYKLVLTQSAEFLKETPNPEQQGNLLRSRPKVLLAISYNEAVELYRRYRGNILGVITDVGMILNRGDAPSTEKLDAGIDLVNIIRADDPHMPILVQSSQGSMAEVAASLKAGFMRKYSRTLFEQLSDYIRDEFGFGDFVFRDSRGVEWGRAGSLQELEKVVGSVPDGVLLSNTSRNMFSKWFFARGLFSLGRTFRTAHHTDAAEAREFLVNQVRSYRKSIGRGVVASFTSNYDGTISFTRLGEGSLGGKARGLAYLNKLVDKYSLDSAYEGISITIPRSIVLSTDYFDEFMRTNGLYFVIDSDLSDAEILSEFVASRLPESLVSQLRIYLGTVTTPLAVRSSSKLEDSNYQPFAGVYSTYMIPFTDNREQMLRMLDKAIKSVYASVYYSSSRTYIQSTGNLQGEEKMGVIIQNVCGSVHEGRYFPMISGVARSVNFYPIGNEKADDGIVNVVYGLGKAVVDGEHTLRFNPKFPRKILQLSQPDTAIRDTQRRMFVLDMNPRSFRVSRNEGVNLRYLPVSEVALTYPFPQYVISTYDGASDRMTPGIDVKGPRVVSFDGLLKYARFPFARVLCEILDICRRELQCEVEMEFAADMLPDGSKLQMKLLQVRPISIHSEIEDLDIDKLTSELSPVMIRSSRALGTGRVDGVRKIVFVDPETFDSMGTVPVAREIAKINASLREQGEGGYILVGPGRWGSSDPNLGIPVQWADISEARMIVELSIPGFMVEASQGTHFFQNITALGVGYLSINLPYGDGLLDADSIRSLPLSYDGGKVKVYDAPDNLTGYIDHRSSRAVVGILGAEREAAGGTGPGLPQ